MLSAGVHKDLTQYRAKVVGGLTLRTLTCIACALGMSAGTAAYAWFVLGIDFDDISFLVYGVSIPFWLLGFFRPDGMEFEEWLPYWWRHNVGSDRLTYDSDRRLRSEWEGAEALEPTTRATTAEYEKLTGLRGIESWAPGGEPDD